MNVRTLSLRKQDSPTAILANLEQRRDELIAERKQCDVDIVALGRRRSDALIAVQLDEADRLDAELTSRVSRRARIDDALTRIRELAAEQRTEHAQRERIKHNDEMAKRIEALAAKLTSFDEQATALGALGKAIAGDVEAIHSLGISYLTLEQACLHRLRQSLHGLVGIRVDLPLGREVPIFVVTEAGRSEWFAAYSPAKVIEEARRNYVKQDPTPPKEGS